MVETSKQGKSILMYIDLPWINSHWQVSWKKWMLNEGFEETERYQWVWLGGDQRAVKLQKGWMSVGFGQALATRRQALSFKDGADENILRTV